MEIIKKYKDFNNYLDNSIPIFLRKIPRKVQDIQQKYTNNSKIQLNQYKKLILPMKEDKPTQGTGKKFREMNIGKISKEELRNFFQETEEGRQMMEDMKEIMRNKKK